MKNKYHFMNVLRALSMVAIVFYHMVFTLYLYGIRQYESISFLFCNINMHIAKVGVCLFFMLSGAGLVLSEKGRVDKVFSIKAFYKKRFVRILIPFYIVYVCYFAYLLISGQMSLTNPFGLREVSPFSFIFTILGMDAYLDSFRFNTCSLGIGEWFLGCLILIYIIYPLIKKAMDKNPYIAMAQFTVYYIAMIYLYDHLPIINRVPMYTNLVIKIYDFILGMFLAKIIDRIPKWTMFASLAGTAFFAIYPKSLPGIDSFQIPIQCLLIFLLFAGLEDVFQKMPKPMRIVEIICAYSYEYFLIHHAVILHLSERGRNTAFSNTDILILFLEEIAITAILSLALKFVTTKIARLKVLS